MATGTAPTKRYSLRRRSPSPPPPPPPPPPLHPGRAQWAPTLRLCAPARRICEHAHTHTQARAPLQTCVCPCSTAAHSNASSSSSSSSSSLLSLPPRPLFAALEAQGRGSRARRPEGAATPAASGGASHIQMFLSRLQVASRVPDCRGGKGEGGGSAMVIGSDGQGTSIRCNQRNLLLMSLFCVCTCTVDAQRTRRKRKHTTLALCCREGKKKNMGVSGRLCCTGRCLSTGHWSLHSPDSGKGGGGGDVVPCVQCAG